MEIQLVFEFVDEEAGHYRAERLVDLPAVPRVGEMIWVAKVFALRVKGVSWLWKGEHFPSLWLERSEGTSSSIEQLDSLTLKIPPSYVKDLRDAGWSIDIP